MVFNPVSPISLHSPFFVLPTAAEACVEEDPNVGVRNVSSRAKV